MRPLAILSVPALLATLVACIDDVGKDKVAATIEDAPEPSADAPSADKAGPTGTALAVDLDQSSLRAIGAKITAEHPIDFKDYTGQIRVDGTSVSGIDFEVTMATLESDHPKLTAHLKNEDFFAVDKFPKATFRSTAVKDGTESEGFTHTVTGDLTVRGTTKRVTFPAKVEVSESSVKASTTFVLNRKDFGIVYPGRPDDLVQDNVRMEIAFTAPRSS